MVIIYNAKAMVISCMWLNESFFAFYQLQNKGRISKPKWRKYIICDQLYDNVNFIIL